MRANGSNLGIDGRAGLGRLGSIGSRNNLGVWFSHKGLGYVFQNYREALFPWK
jgi:hypothetical protein